MCDYDVLQSIPEADIPKLREIFKPQLPKATYVYNYLSSAIRWKKQRPGKNYITLMAPDGKWEDGTFVAVHDGYSCYELFVFTLEKDCKTLCEALLKTRKVSWDRSMVLYATYGEHYPIISKALEQTSFRDYHWNILDIWWLPKEKALDFETTCPPEVYVAKLNESHASIINSHWPHRYHKSETYIAKLIEMNGGCGVFLKSNGMMVAWVLKNLLGLGALQTMDEYKRKGYGSLVSKVLAKEMAQEGLDPIATVLQDNEGSRAMFGKLGFKILESVVFTEYQQKSDLHNEN